MSRTRAVALLAAGLLTAVAGHAAMQPPSTTGDFDPAHTRIGFTLRTRWGQQLEGRFPRYGGQVLRLSDGRQQVRVHLDAAAVEIVGYPRYTAFSRGRDFFDVERYPWASFDSDPYPPALLVEGGRLTGTLRLHGVNQREVFTVEPTGCARPAIDCDLVAHGSVRREDYGMDEWKVAVRSRVTFELRLRLKPEVGT